MLFFDLSVETKRKIDRSLELSCPDICLKVKNAFNDLYEQFLELECQNWIFRSCFVRNGQVTDNCAIMQWGDNWPKEGLVKVHAEIAAQKMFGLFTRKAMLDRMILSIVGLIMGKGSKESSLLNFANQKCIPSEIEADIKDTLKIVGEPVVQSEKTCRNCKSIIRGEKSTVKYSCTINGWDEMKAYRDKHIAHRDIDYELEDTRVQYVTVEDCIRRILKAIQVVYPDADFRVDWEQRKDIISRKYSDLPQWTNYPGEPRIVQKLKELAFLKQQDRVRKLEHLAEWHAEKLVRLDEESQEIALRGIKESTREENGEIRVVDVEDVEDDDIRAMHEKEDEIREAENNLRAVQERIAKKRAEIERIRSS